MQPPPRVPPRFVPTLTEVVQAAEAPPPARPTVAPGHDTAAIAPTLPLPGAPAGEQIRRAAPVAQTAMGARMPVVSRPGPAAVAPAVQTPPAPARPPVDAVAAAPALMEPSRPQRPEGAAMPGAAAQPVPAVPAAPTVVSPRSPLSASGASAAAQPAAAPVAARPARPMPDGMEEYMVHRVMQRVDVVLDQRLREAIATVVQEQTRSVLPRLREEIESVVRHAVYEAVADELASGASSAPIR